MRDRISRNVPVAGENLDMTGHPAKEKFGEWSSRLEGTIHESDEAEDSGVACKVPPSPIEKEMERRKKMDQMDEIIKEDIERTKE